MKRLRHLPFFVVLFTALSFVSCDSEPVDSELVGNEENENPNPNNPNNPDSGESYWPMAVDNRWTFDNGSEEQDFTMIGTETLSGNLYYKFDQFISPGMEGAGQNVVWVRQNGDNYTCRVGMNTGGTTTQPLNLEYTIIKANLNEGQTWSETATADMGVPGFEFEMITNGTIVEKGINLIVDGQSYNNVIHVRLNQNIMGMVDVECDYWFAQGVGPIKASTSAMGENTDYVLTAFDLN